MAPKTYLPMNSSFKDEDEYVKSLLKLVTSSELLQRLCGGIHILDFVTKKPDLYTTILPQEWREWVQLHDLPAILDLLMKEDLAVLKSLRSANEYSLLGGPEQGTNSTWRGASSPPSSLLDYIMTVRRHSLDRRAEISNTSQEITSTAKSKSLPQHVAVGMKPKKIHEVQNFAKYIDELSAEIASSSPYEITHVVDFGSGQNYLGRVLASPPYNKKVIALESKSLNIDGARAMDVKAKLLMKEKIMRNKKEYRQGLTNGGDSQHLQINRRASIETTDAQNIPGPNGFNLPSSGNIKYIETVISNGDLAVVIPQIAPNPNPSPHLIVISLHSCGNLLHHGLRSILLNPPVKAVAMIGCCYNLATERLAPPTYKLPSLRSLHPRLSHTSASCDPHGFPMSEHLATFQHQHGEGIRLNITARMMAVQAPQNWTEGDCDSFFTKHFYRALLQRILLDRGVVPNPSENEDGNAERANPHEWTGPGAAITIGSLRKACYASFPAYVRGAIAKVISDAEDGARIASLMNDITDEEMAVYEHRYAAKKRELSIIWSLMAFSACVVESVIVVDRWLYLREQEEVKDCWVEAVFDYKLSPRNLVVVGIKK